MRALVVLLMLGASASPQTGYTPGEFQSANPNYPVRNPFYFEGRIDWDLLKITQPANAWEFGQRGIHKQDDLQDTAGAVADYKTSISMNNRTNGSCQLITSAATGFGQNVNPPPCMFTVRLRLANLLKATDPATAVQLFDEVLAIDPLRLGVNAMIGDTYAQQGLYQQAVSAYEAELALSPVTPASVLLTGDEANNAHVHWALANIYQKLNDTRNEITELDLYLQATKWHSDTYPWRIALAQARLAKLRASSLHKR
jgi:tetratricopeptide (TPR) repeat protein